jgi:predicted nucleotide-binding protein
LPSNNKYGKLPGTLFEISLNDVQLPRKELVDPSLPYYTSPVPLIRKFLDLPEMNELDGRLGHVLLYIPNFKAQLAGLLLKRQRLEIRMKSTIPWDSLVLKINYSNDSNNESETVIPKKDREIINLKFLPTALNVLLLTQQGEQIDYQEESPYHARGINSVLPKAAAAQTPQFVFGSTPLDDIAEIPRMKIPMSIKSRNGERRGKKISIIHGHSKGPKEAVARFLENLGLEPIVLHEKPNKGRTIIEKFEEHAKNVGFAIALLTGDDVGKSKKERKQRSRPRQNVIFEFGFFIGKLGRKRVCGLKDKDVEVPSDYDGILYVPLDENEHWKTLLARELMSAGYRLKAHKLLG